VPDGPETADCGICRMAREARAEFALSLPMSDSLPPRWPPQPAAREPAFNVAPSVLALAAAFLAIHVVRTFVLPQDADDWVVFAFSFIPLRATIDIPLTDVPGGDAARYWSFVTYAFLHGDWTHVLVNCLWLVAFGSPLAWRFGTVRFLIFSAAAAIAGAALHLALYQGDRVPMVGASAAISAHMAAVSRFAFSMGGPLFPTRGPAAYRVPAPPLREALRNPRVLGFIGIWFAVNLVFGLGASSSGLVNGAVAWDAHLGGFLAGLILFALFDRT
jgi:membrane associated rhomboid family serine protease